MPADIRRYAVVTAVLLVVFLALGWYAVSSRTAAPRSFEVVSDPAVGDARAETPAAPPAEPTSNERRDGETATAPAPKPAPAFRLSGTVLADRRQAFLKNLETGAEGRYTEGDVLADGVTLLEVRHRQVLLDANGEHVVLDIGVDSGVITGNVAGPWRLQFRQIESGREPMNLDASIAQSGARLTLSVPDPESELQGALAGNSARFEGAFGAYYAKVAGTFNERWDAFEGTGALESVVDGQPQPEDSPQIEAKMTRITDASIRREQDERALIEARYAEVRTLADALKAYAAANGGKLPETLEELVPQFLKDPDLIAVSDGRDLVYTGGALIDNAKREAVAAQYDFQHGGYDEARAADQLRAWEAGLREVWGGEIPVAAPVLRVRFGDPEMTLEIDATGHARNVKADRAGPSVPPQDPAEYEAWARAMRARDQNNLKQLGLVMKMFQAEHNDYLPAGWLSVYPEYLTNPNVLRSPWAPEGTLAYDFLFPAMNQQELYAVAEHVIASGEFAQFRAHPDEPESALEARLASAIPLIVGRDEAPQIPGEEPRRSAVFLDGHVETMTLEEWESSVTPFLPYATR